jgi:ATP-binding cassette subfamily B protein
MNRIQSIVSYRQYASILIRYLRPHRRTLAALALLLVGSIGLQLVNPQIIRYFIDTANAGGTMKPLYFAAGLFIGFSLLQQAISVAAAYFSENLGWKTTNRLRADLASISFRWICRSTSRIRQARSSSASTAM